MRYLPILALLASGPLFAQAPPIQWQAALGGSQTDRGNAVRETTDGGFLVAGEAFSADGQVTDHNGNSDIWVAKLDAAGNTQWQRALGGSGWEGWAHMLICSDGGYLITGFTTSNDGDVSGNHGNDDVWVIKLNAVGSTQWQRCLGGSGSESTGAALQMSDGSYLLAINTTSDDGDIEEFIGFDDTWLVRLSAGGDILWQETYGGSSSDIILSLKETMDGGVIMAGVTTSNDGDVWGTHDSQDGWVVKLNASGVIEWQRALGGTDRETFTSVHETSDGAYYVAGYAASNDGDVSGWHEGYNDEMGPMADGWVVKLSATGVLQWQRCIGGSEDDLFWTSALQTDDGLVAAGFAASDDGNLADIAGPGEFWVVRLNTFGTSQWQRCLGGAGVDSAEDMDNTSDGGWVFLGTTTSDDGDVLGNHGSDDLWLVKLDGGTTGLPEPAHENVSVIADEGVITVGIPDTMVGAPARLIAADGRTVKGLSLSGIRTMHDVNGLPPGIYAVAIGNGAEAVAQRVVLR